MYVAMPFEEKSAKELKITVINVDTESRLERFMKEISTQELRVGAPGVAPIFDLMNFGLELSENAVKHPIMQDMLKDPVKNKFDLVLVSPFLATEVGYYLAHKFNASIAIVRIGSFALMIEMLSSSSLSVFHCPKFTSIHHDCHGDADEHSRVADGNPALHHRHELGPESDQYRDHFCL